MDTGRSTLGNLDFKPFKSFMAAFKGNGQTDGWTSPDQYSPSSSSNLGVKIDISVTEI